MAVKPKFRRQINRAARRHGVLPRHLAGLTEVESGFNRRAVSPAGAKWLTQFMPATAESYGVRGDSTRSQFEGAARYLSDLGYERGDKDAIRLALASYNAGPGNPSAAGDYPEKVLAASRKYKGIGRGGRPSRRGGFQRTVKTTPGVDRSGQRQQLKLDYLDRRGDPNALLELAEGLEGAQDVPGRKVTRRVKTKDGYRSPGRKGPATAEPGELIGTPYAGTHTLGNWQSDNAVDIGVPDGTPIIAVSDGVVQKTGGSANQSGRFGGFNLTLSGDNSYFYAHLSKLKVRPGQRVRKGQVLGYSGSANGVPHLHLGVERGDPRKIAARRVAGRRR